MWVASEPCCCAETVCYVCVQEGGGGGFVCNSSYCMTALYSACRCANVCLCLHERRKFHSQLYNIMFCKLCVGLCVCVRYLLRTCTHLLRRWWCQMLLLFPKLACVHEGERSSGGLTLIRSAAPPPPRNSSWHFTRPLIAPKGDHTRLPGQLSATFPHLMSF